MSNTWTDFNTGQKNTNEDWQIYAIYGSGNNQGDNNWEKLFGLNLSRVMKKHLDRISMVMEL